MVQAATVVTAATLKAAEMTNKNESPIQRAVARQEERGLSVWKHIFSPGMAEEVTLEMPDPATILSADWEGDMACVWVQVRPGRISRRRRLLVVQTSRENLPPARYISTIRNSAGCAFHVFEVF